MDDTISRASAIAAILKKPAWHNSDGSYYHSSDIKDAIEALPSAQPEKRTDKRTETHGVCLDAISRQAAIDVCRAPHMRNADCSDFEDDEV